MLLKPKSDQWEARRTEGRESEKGEMGKGWEQVCGEGVIKMEGGMKNRGGMEKTGENG